jgi:hypothetical protein
VPNQVAKEVEQYGDIVLVREKTTYKSILLKTFFVLEYAVKHYDLRYVLKTDDDAFVHVSALVHQLRLLCHTPDCRCAREEIPGNPCPCRAALPHAASGARHAVTDDALLACMWKGSHMHGISGVQSQC